MSSLTPEQKAKLADLIQTHLSGGIFIPREAAERLRKAIEGIHELQEKEEELIRKHEERKKETEEVIRKGKELSARIKTTLQESQESQESEAKPDSCEDDTCAVTLPSFEDFKAPDYYAKLQGSEWALVPEHHTFSEDVQKLMSYDETIDGNEREFKEGLERLSYLIEHSLPSGGQDHTLDLTCLDISNVGHYLDSILWCFREQGAWTEYKRWYEEGIQLTERLMAIKAKDPSIFLNDAIHGIASSYEHYQAITKA